MKLFLTQPPSPTSEPEDNQMANRAKKAPAEHSSTETKTETNLSRREFLQAALGSIGVIFALFKGADIYSLASEVKKTLNELLPIKSAQEFVGKYQEELSRIKLGFNLSPPHLEYIFGKVPEIGYENSLDIPAPAELVNFLVNEVGLSGPCRMPIYFDKCGYDGSRFRFDYYKPWFDALIAHKVPIWANVGIKASRWPEIHISDEELKSLYGGKVPEKGHLIHADDPLSKHAVQLQRDFAQFLTDTYESTSVVELIQVENEPTNGFGSRGYKVLPEAIEREVLTASLFFPNAKIMVNCAPVLGMWREQNTLLVKLQNLYPNLAKRLVSAVNHYTISPPSQLDPTGSDLGDSLFLSQAPRPFFEDDPPSVSLNLMQAGIEVAVTELQAEPWHSMNDRVKNLPGNDMHIMWLTILRSLGYFPKHRPLNKPKYDVLVWGVEELIRRFLDKDRGERTFNAHHREILKTFRLINRLS